jgi:hypothetical protein
MLPRILLVVMAIFVSYSLTGISGYLIYTLSQGRSETQLSLIVRFILNPVIALAVGASVGLLSKDHPALVSIVGLAPWAVILHGSSSGGVILGWFMWVAPILIYLALGATGSVLACRVRNRSTVAKATAGTWGVHIERRKRLGPHPGG